MSDNYADNSKATFRSIGFNMAIGAVSLGVTLFLFAAAVRCRSTHIAPRCEARPRNTIYNPDPKCDPSQNRGNPFLLGWVWWVLSFSYAELIQGIPGTGTREGGLKGKELNVNLDDIVLLRFNALGLKISIASMIVYCAVCMPAYFYARCPHVPLDVELGTVEEADFIECMGNVTEGNFTFTSFSRFTIANVPSMDDSFFSSEYHVQAFRLYCVVFASWFMAWYVCFELFHEWIDLLAIRRVYYLEYDVWGGRKAELEETMLCQTTNADNDRPLSKKERMAKEPHIYQRENWIPHPEQRDTPPSIELYSVLVGGVPSRPEEVVRSEDLEAALGNDGSSTEIDWQLAMTSEFFDACVPNQPGFTSSVAAVTILPSALELAIAWNHWGIAAQKLSRLRFIRRRIRALGHTPAGQKLLDVKPNNERRNSVHRQLANERNTPSEKKFIDSARRREYSAEVLGCGGHDDTNDAFWESLDLGPEQVASYNLEMAQSVAGCCPHGCCQEKISFCKDIDALLEMEADAAEEVNEAYLQLKEAGRSAAHSQHKKTGLQVVAEHLFKDKDDENEDAPISTEEELLRRRSAESERRRPTHTNSQNGQAQKVSVASSGKARFDFRSSVLGNASVSLHEENPKNEDPWSVVQTIACESKNRKLTVSQKYTVDDGRWASLTCKLLAGHIKGKILNLLMWTHEESEKITDVTARDSTYAIVTFTSRQAAIAARRCLTDGRGAKSFNTLKAIPVPPLADSSALNICDCRGFTRPVTIGLNEHQKTYRNTFVTILVALIYVFYTVPVTTAGGYFTNLLYKIYPDLSNTFSQETIKSTLNGGCLTLLLSLLPDLFLFLANVGSNATSLVAAENAALGFYWYFMLVFAMVGQTVSKMALDLYQNGAFDIWTNLGVISETVPLGVSSIWLSWIIFKALISGPPFWLFQLNTWLAATFRLKCCVRLCRGGGSGAQLPYRIYVDTGTVLLCSLALAPATPVIAPFAVLYFIIYTPLLRYVLIYTYKPQYDSGGERWPRVFDIIVGSMMVAHVILSVILVLKKAIAPGVLAGLPVIVIFLFRKMTLDRFKDAYMDAALLQTSLLDGWDVSPDKKKMTFAEREEFRRFLVDSHKASYVPACVAAINSQNVITAEPAVVQAMTQEELSEEAQIDARVTSSASQSAEGTVHDRRAMFRDVGHNQFGALNRRQVLLSDHEASHEQRNEHLPPNSIRSSASETADENDSHHAPSVKLILALSGTVEEDELTQKEYVYIHETEKDK